MCYVIIYYDYFEFVTNYIISSDWLVKKLVIKNGLSKTVPGKRRSIIELKKIHLSNKAIVHQFKSSQSDVSCKIK